MVCLIILVSKTLEWQAASENLQNLEENMKDGQWKKQITRGSWYGKRQGQNPRIGEKCEQSVKMVRCVVLNGSAWSTEKKHMNSIFFGIEHKTRKYEMEEQINKEVNEDWRFAADAARVTDVNASSGVFVAVDSDLGVVIDKEGGSVVSIPWNEWLNVEHPRKVNEKMQTYFHHMFRN